MKNLILLTALLLTQSQFYAQKENQDFDATLAEKYGADDFGMKTYVMVILLTGPENALSKEEVSEAFTGHMNNILKLVKEEKLIIAGPFMKNDRNYRGIFILNVNTIEQAQELVNTDPAVQAGLLSADYFPWYGSAALPAYIEQSKKVGKYIIGE